LNAVAAHSGELQREALRPGREEERRTQWTDREAGQLEDQGDEEKDDDGSMVVSLSVRQWTDRHFRLQVICFCPTGL
jgi:hypothetical protein